MSRQILNVHVHVECIESYSFKCFVPNFFDVCDLGVLIVGEEAVKLLKSLGVTPYSFERLHNISGASASLAYETFERLIGLYEQRPERLKVKLTLDNSKLH